MKNPNIRQGLVIAVILLFIGLALAPSINAKINNEPIPDLDCEGDLYWDGEDLEPGDVLTGEFTVENIGEPFSELDWQIVSCPFWGTWTFDPESGTGLTPEDGWITVMVELILEVEINETIGGEIGIQNVEDENDICYIDTVIQKKSDDDEPIEFDVEFCGLGEKHTVKLTRQEADEVELLFDDIEQQLSEVDTREEAEEIFKEAVVELDKYGLLGSLRIRQAQRLITRNNKHLHVLNQNLLDNNSNYLCLIAGESDDSQFFSLPKFIRTVTAFISIKWMLELLGIEWDSYWDKVFETIAFRWPWHIGGLVSYGHYIWDMTTYEYPANGWVFTFGLNGLKTWNGQIYGQIVDFPAILGNGVYSGTYGFIGVKIHTEQNDFKSKFLGSALGVKIDYEPPDI